MTKSRAWSLVFAICGWTRSSRWSRRHYKLRERLLASRVGRGSDTGSHLAASAERLHHETMTLPVDDHLQLLSRQFLVTALHRSHPSLVVDSSQPGPLRQTLTSKHSQSVAPFLHGGAIPECRRRPCGCLEGSPHFGGRCRRQQHGHFSLIAPVFDSDSLSDIVSVYSFNIAGPDPSTNLPHSSTFDINVLFDCPHSTFNIEVLFDNSSLDIDAPMAVNPNVVDPLSSFSFDMSSSRITPSRLLQTLIKTKT